MNFSEDNLEYCRSCIHSGTDGCYLEGLYSKPETNVEICGSHPCILSTLETIAQRQIKPKLPPRYATPIKTINCHPIFLRYFYKEFPAIHINQKCLLSSHQNILIENLWMF